MKPEIEHFRIFGCSMYFHVPKKKKEEIQARPFREKRYIYGINSESSKTFQIYIPGWRKIETSRDVVPEEEIAFQRSKESQMEIDNETIPSSPSAIQRET